MSTLSLRIPESLHRELRELARREGVSINQVVSSAVGEKIASLKTLAYLQERAHRGKRHQFEKVLARVPDVEPDDADRFPSQVPKPARPVRRSRRRATA